ncbi:TPR repeat [Acidimicrobiia bacterium]
MSNLPSGESGTAARKAARAQSSSVPPRGKAKAKGNPSPRAKEPSAPVRKKLDPDALVALEEERDFLLRSLEDLEREYAAGDVDQSDYVALNDDYTARAADVIRAIDSRNELAVSTRPVRSWKQSALTLGLVALLGVGAGWVVFRDSGTRAPGQGLSGDVRQDSANLILRAQGYTGQASAALQAGDTDKALEQYELAIESYDKALELSPANVEALTYRGWVLHTLATNSEASIATQLDAQARIFIDQAISVDPTYADARVFRAILERNAGKFAAAQIDLDAVDMKAIPPFMKNMIDSVRNDVAAGLASSR